MIARWISFLLFILAGWLIKRLLTRSSSPQTGSAPRSTAPRSGELMVRDPVCKAFITRGSAVSLDRGREHLFFCSTRCRDAFLSGAS